MENNLESIVLILEQLKNLKIPASKIEKDLGFSNGLLKKGKLSNEKWEKLLKYYEEKVPTTYNQKGEKVNPASTEDLPEGIMEIKGVVGYAINKSLVSWEQYEEFGKTHPVKFIRKQQWIDDIKEICNKEGITPQELVKQWKEGSLKNGNWNEAVKARKMEKELDHEKFIEKYGNNSFIEIDRELNKPNTNTGLSKWQLELRKKKIGI